MMDKTIQKKSQGQRLMMAGYSKCYRALVDHAEVRPDVMAELVGIRLKTAQALLRAFDSLMLAHVVRWEETTRADGANYLVPVYTLGGGTSADPPRPTIGWHTRGPAPVKVELATFAAAIGALQTGEWHRKGLAIELGITENAARNLVKSLRADKLVRISSWATRYPMFSFGIDLPDVAKPHRSKKAQTRRAAKLRYARKVAKRTLMRMAGQTRMEACAA